MDAEYNSIEFRRETVRLMCEIHNYVSFCTKELKIDAIDWHVFSCVMYYSAKNGNMFKYNDPSFDKNIEISHGAINAKSIYLTLGMARETVRRRLKYLESRGFIIKVKNGYAMVPQFGSGDHTENMRKYFFSIINREIVRVEDVMTQP